MVHVYLYLAKIEERIRLCAIYDRSGVLSGIARKVLVLTAASCTLAPSWKSKRNERLRLLPRHLPLAGATTTILSTRMRGVKNPTFQISKGQWENLNARSAFSIFPLAFGI